MRARLKKAGIADTWMREVSNQLLPRKAAPPIAAKSIVPAQDTTSVDSLVQSLVDSMANISRRRVDSLDAATRLRLQARLTTMRSQIRDEIIRQIELSKNRDRREFVTQSEQTQMTRALLDEMNANLEVLRDSLRADRERRLRNDLQFGGGVSARSFVAHTREKCAGSTTSTTRWFHKLSQIHGTIGWGDAKSEALVDIRYSPSEGNPALAEGYAIWHFGNDSVTHSVGAGVFDTPFGLEPDGFHELFAPTPSLVTDRIPGIEPGLWLVPWQTERMRLLLLPYGTWDEDNQAGLAQLHLEWPGFTADLTGGGSLGRDDDDKALDEFYGDLTLSYTGEDWEWGVEGLFHRTVGPAYGQTYEPWGLRSNVDLWGGLLLVHRKISVHWGWTLRADYVDERTTLPNVESLGLSESDYSIYPYDRWQAKNREASATTGPVFTLNGGKLRLMLMYSAHLRSWRKAYEPKHTGQEHRLDFSLSHTF